MAVPFRHTLLLAAACALAVPCFGDEIRLKDGKKLYGVIVAYEENMFKVKTDFGYVLVEKDKIASIVPTTPAGPPPDPKAQPAKNALDATKADPRAATKTEPAVAFGAEAAPPVTNASEKAVIASATTKTEKGGVKVSGAAVKPSLPANTTPPAPTAPALKGAPLAANTAAASITPQPAPPAKKPEIPGIREEAVGNVYVNHTHGF